MPRSSISARGSLPADLLTAIERAGYYPALVADVVSHAVGGRPVAASLVHQETTFDRDAVRRHITVLVVTDGTLVIAHADDHEGHPGEEPVATATSESVPLSAVRAVMVTHVVPDPSNYVPGSLGREVTLTLGWGTVSRIDIGPISCGDPSCEADHGYEGTVTGDDISVRVSADADGSDIVERALTFAAAISAATGLPVRR
ncbi:MAG TPA: phosphodiesterase [Intrasporangiaceae bacterium]|nr:phosphodiesterase [Intrasporangiaceae bacterium]